MEEELNIFRVVESGVGSRSLGGLLLVPGLTGIDSCFPTKNESTSFIYSRSPIHQTNVHTLEDT